MSRIAAMLAAYDTDTRTLSNKTLTSPVINTPTINTPTYAGSTTIADVTLTGTVAGAATYTTPHLDTPTFTAVPIDLPASSTMSSVAVVDLSSIQTLTNKTLTSPVLGGTATGTYTLGGTPTISGATLTNPIITGGTAKGSAAGGAGSIVELTANQTGMTDNSNVTFYTVTIPNGVHGAAVRLVAMGTLGDGDSTHTQEYFLAISRITGADTKATLSAAVGSVKTTGATGDATITVSLGSNVGAIGAQQTFVIQAKVARSAGAAANHRATMNAHLMNNWASGITIA